MTDLPRFTGSLRAFSGINSSNDPCEQQRLREELQWKKKQKSKPTTLSWLEIQNQIREGKNKQKVVNKRVFSTSFFCLILKYYFSKTIFYLRKLKEENNVSSLMSRYLGYYM